jgi:lipopolysaccharide transport system ATP-binding protein
MSSDVILSVENVSKLYRLGTVGTGTFGGDVQRFWKTKVLGQEDPFLKIGQTNDRTSKEKAEFVWALQNINFEVKRGEVLGIIGKNGAGKSTLLKLLSRITAPTTGNIRSAGRMASLLEVGTGFHPELTGRENIFLNGAILGMTKREIQSKFDEIVDFSGCELYIDTPVKRYSSGMTVRLGFAVAAFLDPEILVVDEVLAVGDAEFQKKAIGKMKQVSKKEGRTVLFVSHNLISVRSLCNKGIVIDNGMIAYSGEVNDAVDKYIDFGKPSLKVNTLDLLKHPDKKNLDHGLLKASVYSNNIESNRIISGEQFEIVLEYNAKNDFISPEVGVLFKFDNGTPILGLNNKHLKQVIKIKKGVGKVSISIKKFPIIYQGDILVNLYFGDLGASDYECLENAFVLNVELTDVYNSGIKLDERLNSFIIQDLQIKNL